MSGGIPKGAANVAIVPATPIATIVDSSGILPITAAAPARERLAGPEFYWVDIFAGNDAERKDLLAELGLEETDIAWAQRFGQAGRLTISRQKLRAVTWLAEPCGKLVEMHLLCSHRRILTIWRGDPALLADIRQHFAERIGEVGKSPYQASGVLLQLLLGTLDHAVRALDASLDHLRAQLDDGLGVADYSRLAGRREAFHSAWSGFDRYGSAVRSAMVGVEAVPGMDARGAEELNDYADQVEDFQDKLQERRRRMSDILHDAASAFAERQGEQINRLTLVSLLFLPVTAVTGFFGMNFGWMISALGSETAFFVFGLLLPTLMVLLTVAWFIHRGFIQIGFRLHAPGKDPRKWDDAK